MIISFHGGACVKFQTGDLVIAVNPGVAERGSKQAKFGSDIVLCSSFAKDHHNIESVSYGEKQPFLVDSPGRFEFKDISISGEMIGKGEGSEHISAVYRFEMDDISVAVLPGLLHKDEINPDASELCADIDILIIPVNGEHLALAEQLVTFFDPKLVIPVGYWGAKEAQLTKFCKDIAGVVPSPVEKLTIKRKEITNLSKNVVLFDI